MSVGRRQREADAEEGQPEEDDVEQLDKNDQQDHRADGNDRNRHGADKADVEAALAAPAGRQRTLQREGQHGPDQFAEAGVAHRAYLPGLVETERGHVLVLR